VSAAAAATPKPVLPDEQSRDRILAAAVEIAAESGYAATTISKVTARSGLPVSSVYWFFEDKDSLFAEVVRHSYQAWTSRQPAWVVPVEGTPFVEALTTVLRGSLHGLSEAPEFLRIGQMLTLQNPSAESAARTAFLEIRAGVEQTIAGWFEANLPVEVTGTRSLLSRQLAQVVLAANEGLFVAEQIDDDWDADEMVGVIVDVVLAAIRRAPSSGEQGDQWQESAGRT
jgi:AcrR family transcriptional regulator